MEEEALGEGRLVVRIGADDFIGLDRNLGPDRQANAKAWPAGMNVNA